MNPEKFLEVIDGETNRTKISLKKNSPDEALISFYERHDQVATAVLKNSKEKISCHDGCSYCCYFKVEVKPVEIIAIIQYIEKNFNAEQRKKIESKAKENIKEFKLLNYSEQVATNQACPFLSNDSCSIYEVRPTKCRNNHATDTSLCKACFDNSTDTSLSSSYIKPLHLAVNGLTQGFESALEEDKYDTASYDINKIFIAALDNKKFKKRYLKKKKTIID